MSPQHMLFFSVLMISLLPGRGRDIMTIIEIDMSDTAKALS